MLSTMPVMSAQEKPIQYSAPTMEPMEEPVTAEKEIPASSKALSAPRCAIPFAPPEPSASPRMTGRLRAKNALMPASHPMVRTSRRFLSIVHFFLQNVNCLAQFLHHFCPFPPVRASETGKIAEYGAHTS